VKKFLFAALMVIGSSAMAATVTIDFNEFAPSEIAGFLSVQSKGFEFKTDGTICDDPSDTLSSVSSGGISIRSPVSEPGYCAVGISMESLSGSTFGIESFKLVASGFVYSGTLAGGGAADLSAVVGTGDWLTLASFQVTEASPFYNYLNLDDIVVNVVPIPAAVWLFGSALAGFALLRRPAKAP